MGSGTKNRKKSDSPYIRIPKGSFLDSNITSAGVSGGGIASVCIASFEVKVKDNYLAKSGIRVHLQKKDDAYQILIGGTIIGSLNKRQSKMISYCASMGVKYIGEIITKKKLPYARFVRV
jgi:hypothetical protein